MISIHATGRLTSDPRYTEGKDGKRSVLHGTIAIDRQLSKEQRDKEGAVTADFPNIVAWGSTADFIHKYFKKGDKIEIVSDQLATGSYEKDGQKIYTTEINVRKAGFVEGKGAANGASDHQTPTAAPAATGGVEDVPTSEPSDDDFDFSL